MAINTQHHN